MSRRDPPTTTTQVSADLCPSESESFVIYHSTMIFCRLIIILQLHHSLTIVSLSLPYLRHQIRLMPRPFADCQFRVSLSITLLTLNKADRKGLCLEFKEELTKYILVWIV